eukprot:1394569-Amorphochlora_amoeboformis.AAC.1
MDDPKSLLLLAQSMDIKQRTRNSTAPTRDLPPRHKPITIPHDMVTHGVPLTGSLPQLRSLLDQGGLSTSRSASSISSQTCSLLSQSLSPPRTTGRGLSKGHSTSTTGSRTKRKSGATIVDRRSGGGRKGRVKAGKGGRVVKAAKGRAGPGARGGLGGGKDRNVSVNRRRSGLTPSIGIRRSNSCRTLRGNVAKSFPDLRKVVSIGGKQNKAIRSGGTGRLAGVLGYKAEQQHQLVRRMTPSGGLGGVGDSKSSGRKRLSRRASSSSPRVLTIRVPGGRLSGDVKGAVVRLTRSNTAEAKITIHQRPSHNASKPNKQSNTPTKSGSGPGAGVRVGRGTEHKGSGASKGGGTGRKGIAGGGKGAGTEIGPVLGSGALTGDSGGGPPRGSGGGSAVGVRSRGASLGALGVSLAGMAGGKRSGKALSPLQLEEERAKARKRIIERRKKTMREIRQLDEKALMAKRKYKQREAQRKKEMEDKEIRRYKIYYHNALKNRLYQ